MLMSMSTGRRLKKSLGSRTYERFLKLLRDARAASGLTQSDAAKLLGKPQSFVAKCEQGERRVDVVELTEFCRIYGCPLADFVARMDSKPRRRAKPNLG
jgi:transcriptional regulator with XRE-family HTH domain